jgi:hypothetical protein
VYYVFGQLLQYWSNRSIYRQNLPASDDVTQILLRLHLKKVNAGNQRYSSQRYSNQRYNSQRATAANALRQRHTATNAAATKLQQPTLQQPTL